MNVDWEAELSGSGIPTIDWEAELSGEGTAPPEPDSDWRDSTLGGVVRGLRDIPDAGAQLLTRGLEAVAPEGSNFEKWAREQRESVEGINRGAEVDYMQNWRGGKDVGFDGGRLTGNVLATLPLVMTGAGPVVIGAVSSAMQPVEGDDFWTQKAIQTGIGGVSGKVGDALFRGIARVVKPNSSKAVQSMMDEGITPTPGQALGGVAKTAEEKLTSVPFLGDVIKSSQGRGVDQFNRAVANRVLAPIGEKVGHATKIGRELVDDVHAKASAAYGKVLDKIDNIGIDREFGAKLNELAFMVSELPKKQQKQFQTILQNRVKDKFIGGQMSGRTMKDADSVLGKKAQDYLFSSDADQRGLGEALSEVQNALRALTTRNAPAGARELSKANKTWALWKRMEKAAGYRGAKNGVFTPSHYEGATQALAKGSQKARGKGLDQNFAEDAVATLSDKIPDSGTTGRALMAYMLGGGGTYIEPVSGTFGLLGASAYIPGIQRGVVNALARRPNAAAPLADALRKGAPGAAIASPHLVQELYRTLKFQ